VDPDAREFLAALLRHQVRFLIVGAHALPFLGRAALIRNKRATGRPRDLADLERLGE
jgi:hypothetical protein